MLPTNQGYWGGDCTMHDFAVSILRVHPISRNVIHYNSPATLAVCIDNGLSENK